MQIYGLIDSYNQFVGNATALIPRFGNEPVAVGFMHQRNHLGNYLFLGGISACYLLSKLKIRPSTFLPLITAISFGLALASSRSIFLYIAFTFLIAIFFQIKKTPSQTIGKPLLLFTAIAVALQLITPHLPIPQSTGAIARIATEATFGVRWIEWQKAWLAFLEHPVLGLGNGGYARWSFEKSLDIPFATSSPTQLFTHSHNILFQLLAEYGILGGIILCTIATLIAINFTKTRKTNEAIFYFSSIAVIVIHSMVEYPLWYANFLLLFTLFIAGQDRKPLQLTLSTAAKKSIFIAAPIAGIMTCLISLSWYTTLVQLEWPSNLSNQEKIDGLIQFHGNPIFSNEADLLLVTQLDSTDQNIDIKLNITTQLMNYRPFEAVAFKHITYLMYKNKQTEAENLIKIYSASSDTFSKRYYQYLTTKVKKDHRLDQSIDLLKQDQLQRAAHQ